MDEDQRIIFLNVDHYTDKLFSNVLLIPSNCRIGVTMLKEHGTSSDIDGLVEYLYGTKQKGECND